MARVLVTGGTGFVGSHVNQMLCDAGHETVVLDNLSRSLPQPRQAGRLVKGDISDTPLVDSLFEQHRFDLVMHFAGLIDVGESFSRPSDYYIQNVAHTTHLLDAMRRHGVKKFVFSSSAAIFGLPDGDKIAEKHAKRPISPYGRSKLMIEEVLADHEDAYGLRSVCLRYFNAAGGDPAGRVKNRKISEHNLIPRLLRSLKTPGAEGASFNLYGTDYATPDGTCIRDYIHVADLGQAHMLGMNQLLNGGNSCAYNLGNGNGYTVKQVISAVERVTDQKVAVTVGPRRRGDPPRLVADASQIQRELGWSVDHPNLDEMVAHAWKALSD